MKKLVVLAAVFLGGLWTLQSEPPPAFSWEYWRDLSHDEKMVFVAGWMQGLLYAKLMVGDMVDSDEYNRRFGKIVGWMNNDTVARQVDEFYKVTENRPVPVADIVMLTCMYRNGASATDIARLAATLRSRYGDGVDLERLRP